MGKDIEATAANELDWNHSALDKSLEAVRTHVESEALKASAWYFQRKRSKALLSRALRLGSIVAASAGGLLPIAASVAETKAPAGWASAGLTASMLVGLAAALLGADKAFGFSSGWIRYVTTASKIRGALEDFRMEWTLKYAAAGGTLEQAHVLELLQLAKRFRSLVESHVFEETKAWTNEFKGSLTQLERESAPQLDPGKQDDGQPRLIQQVPAPRTSGLARS